MLQFISTYRGCAHYLVTKGAMCGKRIRVHYWNEEFYKKEWNGGQHWNITLDEYNREVVGAAGIVDYVGTPVSADVLDAVNNAFTKSGSNLTSDFPGTYRTARFDKEQGWVVQEALSCAS